MCLSYHYIKQNKHHQNDTTEDTKKLLIYKCQNTIFYETGTLYFSATTNSQCERLNLMPKYLTYV